MEKLLKRYPALEAVSEELRSALAVLTETYKNGGKLLLCGNGGSAADCDHIAGELLKGFKRKRPMSEEDIARFRRNVQLRKLRPLRHGTYP